MAPASTSEAKTSGGFAAACAGLDADDFDSSGFSSAGLESGGFAAELAAALGDGEESAAMLADAVVFCCGGACGAGADSAGVLVTVGAKGCAGSGRCVRVHHAATMPSRTTVARPPRARVRLVLNVEVSVAVLVSEVSASGSGGAGMADAGATAVAAAADAGAGFASTGAGGFTGGGLL